MSTQYLVEMAHLFSDRSVPYTSHQVAQVCKASLESCLLRAQPDLAIALLVLRAIESKPQKGNRFRTSPASFARVPLGTSPALDELGLGRFQCEAKLSHPLAQRLLDPPGIRPTRAAHHKVVEGPHPLGFAL